MKISNQCNKHFWEMKGEEDCTLSGLLCFSTIKHTEHSQIQGETETSADTPTSMTVYLVSAYH